MPKPVLEPQTPMPAHMPVDGLSPLPQTDTTLATISIDNKGRV